MELLIAAATVCPMVLLMAENARIVWLVRPTSCRPCSTAMETALAMALEMCSPKPGMEFEGWPSMLSLNRSKCQQEYGCK
jgi:hypothetical protein